MITGGLFYRKPLQKWRRDSREGGIDERHFMKPAVTKVHWGSQLEDLSSIDGKYIAFLSKLAVAIPP